MSVRRSTAQVALCLALIAMVLSTIAGCEGTDSGPKVSWDSPSQGSDVFGIVRLKGRTISGEGISEVKFHCDPVDNAHQIGTVANPTDSL